MRMLIVLRAYPPQISPSGGLMAKLLQEFPEEWDIEILTEQMNGQNNYINHFVTEKRKENKYWSFVKRNLGKSPYEKKRIKYIKNKIEKLDTSSHYDYIIAATPNEIVALTLATTKAKKVAISMEKFFNMQTLNIAQNKVKKEQRNELLYRKMMQDFTFVFAFPMMYNKLKQFEHEENVLEIEHPMLVDNVTNTPTLKQMVYAGALDRSQRPPKRALNIVVPLCEKLKMNAKWYGGGNGFTEVESVSQKKDCIKNMGFASSDVIHGAYRESEILISIGNSDSEVVPSKVLEYISTGKTILHITNVQNDPAKKYLLRYPKAVIVEEEYEIEHLVNEIKMKNAILLTYDMILDEFNETTPKYVAQTVIKCLQSSK